MTLSNFEAMPLADNTVEHISEDSNVPPLPDRIVLKKNRPESSPYTMLFE